MRLLRASVPPLVEVLLPSDCFSCGRRLGEFQRHGACLECWEALRPIQPPLCVACGLPAPRGSDLLGPARGRCAACVLDPPPYEAARAAVAYDGPARRFLIAAKLGGRRALLASLGEQLASVVRVSGLADGCQRVVPVPAHPWRRLVRGYDPALDLARVVAERIGLRLDTRVLMRRSVSGPGVKVLSRGGRAVAASRAFLACRSVRGEKILLVDDVMTTGSTASACTTALRHAEAAGSRVAVWARTLPRTGGTAYGLRSHRDL